MGLDSESPSHSRAFLDSSPIRSQGFGSNDSGDETHLLHYIKILYRRRWMALGVFAAILVGAVIYIWTTVPTYEARVQLMIEDERARIVVFRDTVAQDDDKADYQQTQYKILQSRALARSTLDVLTLWDNPELNGEDEKNAGRGRKLVDRGLAILSSITARFSKSAPRAAREGRTEDESGKTARVIDAFLSRLTVEPVRNSRLVDVKFQSVDAERAAAVVNALADTYIRQNSEFRSKSSKESSDYLEQQLEAQRARVETSQAALQKYREQTDTVSSGEREAMLQQKLTELNTVLAKARTDRIQREILNNQVKAAGQDEKALQSLPAILANPVVQTLKTELADLTRQDLQLAETLGVRHPDRVKLQYAIDSAHVRLQAEASKTADAIRSEYEAAKEQEDTFVKAINGQKNEAQAMRRNAIEYDALEREAATDRQIFESLLQRTKETGVSSELLTSNIRVIDAADVPRAPVYPQKGLDLLLASMGGLVFAVCSAFFVHYLDKAIKTPDQVKNELGLPCLGLVPIVKKGGKEDHSPLLNNGVPPLFKEAFRTVRTNMLFAANQEIPHTLLITSTGPREGKTVVACNLAVALAQTGRRTLLIDADLRRPRVHLVFDCPQEPGLSTLAMGPCDPAANAIQSSVPNLWILPAGEVPHNPAEILSSETFKGLLEVARKQFDWVLIDSAPIMAVTDAALIANVTGAVLFVVGADVTKAPNALNALEQLDSAKARFAGAVLNRVKLERNPFYYNDHYRPEYKDYYVTPKSS